MTCRHRVRSPSAGAVADPKESHSPIILSADHHHRHLHQSQVKIVDVFLQKQRTFLSNLFGAYVHQYLNIVIKEIY